MLVIVFALVFGWSLLSFAEVDLVITSTGDGINLQLSGAKNWDYEIKKEKRNSQEAYRLTLPKLNESSIEKLKKFQSNNLKSIEFQPQGPDGKQTLWLIPKEADLEIFDYLTDQPSRLIVDLFRQEKKNRDSRDSAKDKVATTKKGSSELPAKGETFKNSGEPVKETKEFSKREPASADTLVVKNESIFDFPAKDQKAGVYDASDSNFSRFGIQDFEVREEAIIASNLNSYIDFPVLRTPLPYFEAMMVKKPKYSVEPNESEENKQVRLLITLFNNKRRNVLQKSIEWFNQKFPKSQYDEIVQFMNADNYFERWREESDVKDFDHAMLRYAQAVEAYPNSPLAERTLMLRAFATMDRGDYLGALRLFQYHITNRPQSVNKDIARLGMAEAYLRLNRHADAFKEYEEIEASAALLEHRVMAGFLKGDVLLDNNQNQKAIDTYKAAIQKYGAEAANYPNALYNQAAAYFRLKDYRQSLNVYREFLTKFPSHSYNVFAMTRVGEILEILGADPKRAIGAYLETQFRYGDSPASIVARLRLAAGRMSAMKPKEVEKSVEDMLGLAKKSDLPKIEEFAKLMIADGYASRKEYQKGIELLVSYYQANPIHVNKELFTNRIVKFINEDLRSRVDKGDFLDALRLHSQYADNWLKAIPRIDTKYLVGRAFEQAGVPGEAEVLYKDTINTLLSLRGTNREKERNVFEKLPSADEVYLRLASVSHGQKKYPQTFEYLKSIENPQKLKDAEQVERVHMMADLHAQRGEIDSAIRFYTELIKTWKGLPQLVAEPYYSLAKLEIGQGRLDDALVSLKKVDELMQDSGAVNKVTHAEALEKIAKIYEEKKDLNSAIAIYNQLLNTYEKERPMASIRYRLGAIHFEQGNLKQAKNTWADLKTDENSFWYKLSVEKLKGTEFSDEYKKYIQRIPAMQRTEK